MSDALRYAVLHHTGVDAPHYDLLVETAAGSPLMTYRVDRWPMETGAVLVERLADHRRIYLDYEGPISGNRGSVRRVAQGTCRLHLRGDRMVLHLDTGAQLELSGPPPADPGDAAGA